MNANQANQAAEAYRAAHPKDVDINCLLLHIKAAANNGHFHIEVEREHLPTDKIEALNALGFTVQYVNIWNLFRGKFIVSWR